MAGNNDANPEVAYSAVEVEVNGGTTYHIAIDGNNDETGSIILNYKVIRDDDGMCMPIKTHSGKIVVVCL